MTYPDVRVYIDFTAGAYDAASTWTDVTEYAERVRCEHGRSSLLEEFQPGSGSVVLRNEDGRFDPANESGPHFGDLLPRRRIKVEATHDSVVYPLAYGWIDGWSVEQQWRVDSQAVVNWHDALTVLGRTPVPDSVWDYRVSTLTPLIWWKMGSHTHVEVDGSGNGRHGQYVVYQNDFEPLLAGIPGYETGSWLLPDSIAASTTVEDVIPAAGRPGRSWARMQAEVGQPLGGATGKYPRTPSLISQAPLNAIVTDRIFVVEFWGIFRQAFPLDETGGPASLTAMYQPLFSIGPYAEDGGIEFGVKGDAKPYAGAWNPTWGDLTFDQAMTDGQPHHLVFRSLDSAGDMVVFCYVDGVEVGSVNLGSFPMPAGGFQMIVGHGLRDPDDRGLQSVLGDVVFYDGPLTLATIQINHAAGSIGSLSGLTLTSAEAINQTLDMVGWGLSTSFHAGDRAVSPGPMRGRDALDVMREFAAAENAPLYQAPDGVVTVLSRHWQVELARAAAPAVWRLGDDASSTMGYTDLSFTLGVGSIANYVEVEHADGTQVVENAGSIAEYGRIPVSAGTRLTSPEDALSLAQWLATAYGQPRRRVDRPLTFRAINDDDFEFALGVEFGTRVTIVRTTPDAREVEDDYWVQAIGHVIDPGQGDWRTSLTLERADDPFRMFTLDLSLLDGPDVLAY